jgi:siroheme synthase-like protein
MAGLPAVLNVHDRRCVVVGGGPVALRRARALREAGGQVFVIAPVAEPEFDKLPLEVAHRPYAKGDLDGALLVVVATDDPAVNETVAADARAAGVLVNRTDDPPAGDFSVPAHEHHGPVTIAVDTDGISATAAAAIRRELSNALDPDWPRLLDAVRPYRQWIQDRFAERSERLARLAQLTGPQAMRTLKQAGPQALMAFCDRLADPNQPPPRA